MNIIDLLKQPESKIIEFKRDLSSPASIIRTIIAFSNTAGGTLVIGVEDQSHYVVGISEPHNLEEQLANLISDTVAPNLLPEIDIIPFRETYLLVVRVFPSSSRPHYYKKNGLESGTYVRVGSTNRRADHDIIKELQRIVRNESFDQQPLLGLGSEAINFDAALEQLSHVRKLEFTDLETLELVTMHQGKKVPTVAGMLLFGYQREKYFPDAWIQAGRFDGDDKSFILDSGEFKQYPIEAIESVMGFLEKHAMQNISIDGVRHQRSWSIPLKAVREALINAVVHADYSQRGTPIRVAIFDHRIEIDNPGLLRFGLTITDIKQGISKLRNPIMGRVFHIAGLIERWGSGIQRIITTCKEGGFPEPIFEEIATHFRVTIYTNRQDNNHKIDSVSQTILSFLEQHKEGLTTAIIANAINLSARATRTRLLKLIELGLVSELASSEKDPHRLYFYCDKNVT